MTHKRNPDVLLAALENIASRKDTTSPHPKWRKSLSPVIANVRDACYELGTTVANNECAAIAQAATDATEPDNG